MYLGFILEASLIEGEHPYTCLRMLYRWVVHSIAKLPLATYLTRQEKSAHGWE